MWKCAQDLFGLKSNKMFEPQAYERSFEGIDLWPAQSSLRKRALVKFGVVFSCFCPDPFVDDPFSSRVAEPFDYSILENWLHGVTLRRPKCRQEQQRGSEEEWRAACLLLHMLQSLSLNGNNPSWVVLYAPFLQGSLVLCICVPWHVAQNSSWCPAFVSISSYSHRTDKPHVGNPPTVTKLNASSWRNCDQIHPIEWWF